MKTHIILVSSLWACLVPANAGLVSVKLVKQLEAQSDAIVVASLIGVQQNTVGISFQLKIARIIRGIPAPQSVLDVTTPEKLTAFAGVPKGGGPAAVWFLKQSQPGSFVLLPAQTGDVDLQHAALYAEPSDPAGSYAYLSSDSALDKIVKEVSFFAEKERCVEAEDAIVQSLQGINTPTMIAVLRRFAASNLSWIRGIGVSSLIERGDVASLQQFENDLKGSFADAQFHRSTALLNILAAIELMYRSTNPAGIQVLGRLATSTTPVPRLSLASRYALRAIHTKESLSWLGLLLDSPDQAARYDAMFGIAAFANGLPITTVDGTANLSSLQPDPKAPFADRDTLANVPGFEVYSKDEFRYLTFWKNWWTTHKTTIGN